MAGSRFSASEVDNLVGGRIQRRRKELGITAAVLSEKIDISHQQLTRYERGESKINLGHLIQIAEFLDTPIAWFFTDHEKDDKPKSEEYYSRLKQEELKEKLDFMWPKLSVDQQHAFIVLLDKFLK